MAKRNADNNQQLRNTIERMDEDIAEGVLRQNLKKDHADGKPLSFYSTDPREEGRLRHFLHQLARLCHLRGDMIPRAQEALLKKFFLNHRDRHHLKQMSNAHALRSEEALHHGNAKLALLERLEAWRKMPRNLGLLLDLAEAYIEPNHFAEKNATLAAPPAKVRQAAVLPSQEEAAASPEELVSLNRREQRTRYKERKQQKHQKQQVKEQKKTARMLFQLTAWQYHRQALNYLKKSVELSVGLEQESTGKSPESALNQELMRLQKKLQHHYPRMNWERYTAKIRTLKGRPRPRWPWVLLILLLATLFVLAAVYLPWHSWILKQNPAGEEEPLSQPSEQVLLDLPVPVEWSVPAEHDKDFSKQIQKSQRLKLSQYYAYEVQGHVRVKPSNLPPDVDGTAPQWQSLVPARPFDLQLSYQHRGQVYQNTLSFSYNDNDSDRALIMENDTVLFRQVFRLPDRPHSDDHLQAKITVLGPALESPIVGINQGGFAQRLPSTDLDNNPVETVGLAFRQQVSRSDGEKIRMLGYDIELQNLSKRSLDQLDLRLNWMQEDGISTKENTPILLQRDYSIISGSGTNLVGQSRTTQRLWLEVPQDLNYPIEKLTPQVRIIENRYAP